MPWLQAARCRRDVRSPRLLQGTSRGTRNLDGTLGRNRTRRAEGGTTAAASDGRAGIEDPMAFQRVKILILCKTYPSPSAKHVETSCVAGMTTDGRLLRLYPVPFRLMHDQSQFKKWQWIEADIEKSRDDHRPESHRIRADTISVLGDPSRPRIRGQRGARNWRCFPHSNPLRRWNRLGSCTAQHWDSCQPAKCCRSTSRRPDNRSGARKNGRSLSSNRCKGTYSPTGKLRHCGPYEKFPSTFITDFTR